MMGIGIIAACMLGFGAGAGVMLQRQRRMRMRELEQISRLAEQIMNEITISAGASGEETMFGRIEHQLVRVQEMLQGRKDEAERSRDEIQKLISEIAHQMRTPLANIRTYTGLLGEEPEEKDYLAALEESEKKLCFLVESFVRMARLEQHMIQIRKEEKNIRRTIQNTFGQIQTRAEEKQIRFAVALPEAVSCLHDPNWFGEAFYNVLDNSVKYSETGGRIEVDVSVNEMFLKIRVRDYGIGIDEGEEARIFQRFCRGNRVTNQPGFGIGLYLSREIMNLHGGSMTVKRMDPGIRIEMNLPVSEVNPRQQK